MGDKTQLATVALAAQFQSLIPVWLGTTTGMMIADGIGVIVGNVLGKRIPERTVKWLRLRFSFVRSRRHLRLVHRRQPYGLIAGVI